MGDGTSFFLKAFDIILIGQPCVKDFNGCLCSQAQMFTQVDFCKATLSKEESEAIVAELLTYEISHRSATFQLLLFYVLVDQVHDLMQICMCIYSLLLFSVSGMILFLNHPCISANEDF